MSKGYENEIHLGIVLAKAVGTFENIPHGLTH
jgi:hypothetical protein